MLRADLLDEPAVTAAAARLGGVRTLVADARPAFAAAGGDLAGLQAALDGTWNAVRATVNAAMRPAGAGKVVLLAPGASRRRRRRRRSGRRSRTWPGRPRSSGRATASAPCAILPGDATAEDDVAALVRLARLAGRRLRDGLRLHAGRGAERRAQAPGAAGSSAQGTSTESSCGASRATTYSDGSDDERFSRTWVSRGGT